MHIIEGGYSLDHLYDCIIVGAGPGGSSLAAKLAKNGFDVLLLDKSKFPRYKVCGGGLTKRASEKMPVDPSPIIRDKVNTFIVAEGSKEKYVIEQKNPFLYMVMRDELDQMLVIHAVSCGATFLTNMNVQKVIEHKGFVVVKTSQQMFYGRFVVGADGIHSTVAKQVGLMTDRKKVAALEMEIYCKKNIIEHFNNKIVIDYKSVPNGYLWVFSKGLHISVGIQSHKLSHEEIAPILQSFIRSYKMDGMVLSEKGSFFSEGGRRDRIVTRKTALIGDAAGLVDSFMGEGIYYALWSAELLANRLITEFKQNSSVLVSYQQDVHTKIIPELKLFEYLGRELYNSPQIADNILSHSPKLISVALEVLEGNRRIESIYKKNINSTVGSHFFSNRGQKIKK